MGLIGHRRTKRFPNFISGTKQSQPMNFQPKICSSAVPPKRSPPLRLSTSQFRQTFFATTCSGILIRVLISETVWQSIPGKIASHMSLKYGVESDRARADRREVSYRLTCQLIPVNGPLSLYNHVLRLEHCTSPGK